MGLLNLFAKSATPLLPLPKGSFTVDRDGRLIASTLPQMYPASFAEGIGREIVTAFQSAQAIQNPLYEITVRFANLKLTARELRGGAIVFLVPQTLSSKSSQVQLK
jgi:hypothetical protein